MKYAFGDATYLVGYLDPEDQHHTAARCFPMEGFALVTSDLVLAEVLNSLAKGYTRVAAGKAVMRWLAHPSIEVVHHDRWMFLEALEFYERRPDKDWGLTDCASFLIMDKLGIDDALSADRHFEQAGYNALLRRI